MALKTGDEYLESLESRSLETHVLGKKTDNLAQHDLISPSREALAFTYDRAHDPQSRELFRAESLLCNDEVNRFTHLHASVADLNDPEVGPYIRKYLAANPDYQVLDRMKVMRLIENLTAGAGAVGYLIESMHGVGPPAAQRIMISRQAGLDEKMERVARLLSISAHSPLS